MLQTVLLRTLCVGVAVWLTHVITPMIDRVISMTWSRIALWPLLWRRGEHRAPSGTEPFNLYQAGDPYLNWRWGKPFWDGARIHLVTAAALASIAPLLPLGHNPFGLAGMVVLIPLFGHMVAIDLGESRLPNPLTMLASIIGLATVLLAGILEPERLAASVLGGGLVLFVYGALWFVNKKQLGLGDVKLSFCIGLILGWNGWAMLVYGWAAAWIAQGLFSMALLVMARIQTKKALLPMGPAIIGATFAVPLLFLGYAA